MGDFVLAIAITSSVATVLVFFLSASFDDIVYQRIGFAISIVLLCIGVFTTVLVNTRPEVKETCYVEQSI